MQEVKICGCECEMSAKMREKMLKCDDKRKCECEYEKMMKARMRDKIMEYASKGEIKGLYCAIEEYPELLPDIDNVRFVNTPLHEAAAAGKMEFAQEIMNLMPSFGKKLNPQGLSPLHVAIEKGHTDTALALVKIDKQLGHVKGKGGMTPLHFAAKAHSRRDGINSEGLLPGLLLECPDSLNELNNRSQNAIHVALENQNFEAARLLINWLIIRGRESELLRRDEKGNTALHIAAQHHDCPEKLLKLIMKLVRFNKENYDGRTPLDVAHPDLKEILKEAGGRKGKDVPRHPTMRQYLLDNHSEHWAEHITRSYHFLLRELTEGMRNTILVVAVLIATATYQGVLQPPGGVYSAEGTDNVAISGILSRVPRLHRISDEKPRAGRMVMARNDYSEFMPTNTIAFILSIIIIIFVLPTHYFIVILQASSLGFMCLSYLLALNYISGSNQVSKIMIIVCCSAIGVAFLLRITYYVLKALYHREWLLHRLRVRISNFSDRHSPFITRMCVPSSKNGQPEIPVLSRMRKQYKLIRKI